MNLFKRYVTLFSSADIPTYTRYMMLIAESPAHAEQLVKQIKPGATMLFYHQGSNVTSAFEQYYKALSLSNERGNTHHVTAN